MIDDDSTFVDPQVKESKRRADVVQMGYEVGPAWRDALGGWVSEMRAAGRPETTVRLRRDHLRQFAHQSGAEQPWDVTDKELVSWVAGKRWALDSRRAMRASLRGFYGWGVRVGHIVESPADALPHVSQSAPNPRPVPEVAFTDAVEHADQRVRLMIRLAGEHGMRRAEVAQVHTRDVFAEGGGWSLLVHGKGGKVRIVPLSVAVARELRAVPAGWVFPGAVDGHLSAAWVATLVRQHLPEGYSMHKLRHRAATAWLDVDGDWETVSQLLGHASLETTRRYVLRRSDAKRKLVLAVAS